MKNQTLKQKTFHHANFIFASLIFLGSFLFYTHFAKAANYYVDPVNGSDSNPGTLSQPWQHIAYATCGGDVEHCPSVGTNSSRIMAGDILYLRGGTYGERGIYIDNTGTASNPITIRNYPGEIPVVNGGFIDSTSVVSNEWQMYNLNVVTAGSGYTSGATNVPVTGGSGTGMTVDLGVLSNGQLGAYATINNYGTGYQIGDVITINGGGGTGGSLKIWDSGSPKNGGFPDSVFNLDGTVDGTRGYITLEGLEIENGFGANVLLGLQYPIHDVTVQNCNIYNFIGGANANAGEIYINHGGLNILVQNNKLHGVDLIPDGGGGINPNNSNGIFIENNAETGVFQNNEIFNTGEGIWIKYQQPDLTAPPFVVKNNYIHDLLSSSTWDGATESLAAISVNNWGTQITNNVIYNTSSVGITLGESYSCSVHSNGNALVSHNSIVDTADGVSVNWANGCSTYPDMDNTFKDNVIYNFSTQNGLVVWPYYKSTDTSNTDFDHNILYSSSYPSPIIFSDSCSNGTAFCWYDLFTCPFTICTDNISKTPVFTNASFSSVGDFTLQSNSPGHNAASDGTDVGADTSVVGINITAPVLSEVTPVSSSTTDTTPSYTFQSNQAGTITYGGDCSSSTAKAVIGDNTITFNALSSGTHSNCTITVTDSLGYASFPLIIKNFTITALNTNPPVLSNGSPSTTLSSGTTQTTLSVTTDENSTCKYSITPNTSYGSMTNTFTTTGGTNHTTTISNLTDGNSYAYYVRCQDSANNPDTTDYQISFSIASPTVTSTPVYRFWSSKYDHHFYTDSQSEKDYVISHYPDTTWHYEGIGFNAYNTQAPNTVPVYRFWSNTYDGHFYTASQTEKDYVISHYPSNVWNYEGIAFYAYPTQQSNTLPVYRFWSSLYNGHFYTDSQTEKDYITSHYPANVWNYEGIAWWVPES